MEQAFCPPQWRAKGLLHLQRLAFLNSLFGKDLIDLALQASGMGADQASNRLSAVENNQGWDSLHAVTVRRKFMLVNVNFGKAQFTRVLIAQSLENGSYGATGTTPGGPEIHDDRGARSEHFRLKI